MKALAAVLLAGALAGCFAPGAREAPRYHVLEIEAALPGRARAPRAATLRVAPTTAVPFYDRREIVHSRAPGTRAYYQYNRWVRRPSRAIHEALLERLRARGAFAPVTGRAGATGSALRLETHVEELYHDARTPPGSAKVVLTAVLTDTAGSRVLGRRTFARAAPAASYDAAGAVQAFNRAIGLVLDDVAGWVERAALDAGRLQAAD